MAERKTPSLTEAQAFPVTALLTAAAVFVSVAKLMGKNVDMLGLDVRAFRGEPWRVLSTALPHGDWMHIIFNAIWAWRLGAFVEMRFKSIPTLLLYVLFQTVSALGEYAFVGTGIGLSGIGYGVVAFLWVLRNDPALEGSISKRTVGLFAIWFVLCVVLTLTNVWQIGNVAHGAGALVGALAGVAIRYRDVKRWLAVTGCAALVGFGVAGSTVLRPHVNKSSDRGLDAAYLGYLALEADDPALASSYYLEAVRVNPSKASWWFNLGVAYYRQDEQPKATEAFRKAAALEPTNEKFVDAASH